VVRTLADHSLLAVGEGKAELVLLNHIKELYLQRGCGTTLKVRGGFGKGGKGVIDYAMAVSSGADYTRRIVLLDTDAGWDDVQRARARQANLDVVESNPCLEAWLLAIHGDQRERNSGECKREFKRRFGVEAHDMKVYTTEFTRERLETARRKVPALERLLTLLGV
jgi:hypothetical protein